MATFDKDKATEGTISAPVESDDLFDDIYDMIPSDVEPGGGMMGDDWEYTDTTIVDVTDLGTLTTTVPSGSTDYNIDWNDISITSGNTDLQVEGNIYARRGGENINITEVIHEQKLQIEALTDMLKEMMETKTFDIEWDLEMRVEQKKFINRLKGD